MKQALDYRATIRSELYAAFVCTAIRKYITVFLLFNTFIEGFGAANRERIWRRAHVISKLVSRSGSRRLANCGLSSYRRSASLA